MNIYLITFLILLLFVVVVVVLDIINKIRNKSTTSVPTSLIPLAIPAMVIVVFIFIYYEHTDSQINSGDDTIQLESEEVELLQLKSKGYKIKSIGNIYRDSVNYIYQIEAVMNSLNIENINDMNSENACVCFQALANVLDIEDYSKWYAYSGVHNNAYDSNYESYIFINNEYGDSAFAVFEYGDYLYTYKITNENISDESNNTEDGEVERATYTNVQFSNGGLVDVEIMNGQYVERWVYDYINSNGYGSGNMRIMLYDEDKSGVYYYASYDEDISMNIIRRYKSGFVGDLFYQFRNNEREVYILRYRDSIIEVPMFY